MMAPGMMAPGMMMGSGVMAPGGVNMMPTPNTRDMSFGMPQATPAPPAVFVTSTPTPPAPAAAPAKVCNSKTLRLSFFCRSFFPEARLRPSCVDARAARQDRDACRRRSDRRQRRPGAVRLAHALL